jgi:hypothetical protein
MAFVKPVNNITLTSKNNKEAIDITNIIAQDQRRSATEMAEILIIKAGEDWAEQIKIKKARESKDKQ